MVERDIVLIRGTLCPSNGWHAVMTDWWTGGRLRIDVVEYASGEPHMYETAMSLEQGIVVHSDVLLQGLKAHVESGVLAGLRTESHDLRGDAWVVNGVDVSVHEFF